MSLYLTLPSNSSENFFPENTASHFFTKLPQPIELSRDWEVGLVELQFLNTLANVPSDQIYLTYHRYGPPADASRLIDPNIASGGRMLNENVQVDVIMKGGFYESNQSFIDALNKECDEALGRLPNKKQRLTFFYNFASKHVTFEVYEDNAFIKLNKGLQDILGFDIDEFKGPIKVVASDMMDINQDFKSMFIYCDLVSPRPVGDVMVPLLRTLPIVNDKREVVHSIFDKPHYVPLSRFQFENVEILITSDTGLELSFPQGHTVVTLHFRRAKAEAFEFFK